MGRPAITFEYFKKEFARYGLELERVRAGRGFFNVFLNKKLVFTARDYRELRAFLLGLDFLCRAGVEKGNDKSEEK